MENPILNLQLLDQQNTLDSSNENLLCDELEEIANQSGCQCYKKVQELQQNSVELKQRMTLLKGYLSSYIDKIKDKDDVIAALKMSIELLKNKDTSLELIKLKSQIKDYAVLIEQKNDILKETQAKVQQLETLLQEAKVREESMLTKKMEVMLAKSQTLIDEQVSKLKQKNEYIDGLENTIGSQSEIIIKLRAELKDQEQEIDLLKESLAKVQQLQTLLQEAKLQKEEENNLSQVLESMVINTKEDILADEHALKLKQKNEYINSLENTIGSQSAIIIKLRATIKDQEVKLTKGTQHCDLVTIQMKQKYENLEKISNSNFQALTQLRENIKGYKAKIKNQEQLLSTYQTELNNNKGKLKDNSEPKMAKNWTPILQRHIQYRAPGFMLEFPIQTQGYNYENKQIWIGLEYLHFITTKERHELYIHLVDVDDSTSFAKYDNFVVGNASEEYKLKALGQYTGTAGDGMRASKNTKFTHKRYANKSKEFAVSSWWHAEKENEGCNLNKIHVSGSIIYIWWLGNVRKSVKMFIRPFKV